MSDAQGERLRKALDDVAFVLLVLCLIQFSTCCQTMAGNFNGITAAIDRAAKTCNEAP